MAHLHRKNLKPSILQGVMYSCVLNEVRVKTEKKQNRRVSLLVAEYGLRFLERGRLHGALPHRKCSAFTPRCAMNWMDNHG